MKLAWLLVIAAACGSDDVDLTGTYMVTSDVGSSPCGTDAPITGAPAYLVFQKMNLLGHDYYVFEGCPDATGANCAEGDAFAAFFEPVSSGWSNTETESSNAGTQCFLGYIASSALLHGTDLEIDGTEYQDMVCIPEAQCTTDEAGKRGKTMPCFQHEHIAATKQ
ncbi:MAG TPA: hypothetical protein VGF94_29270 [Kofleriaceae bacterium]|jgi:hypothetical protein